MKLAHGWYFPDDETHLVEWMEQAQQRRGERLCYQLHKYNACMPYVRERRGIAIDVGAHVGQWSWNMAQDFQYVRAFEPVPRYAECWHENMSAFDNKRLAPYALGAREGIVSLAACTPGSNGDTRIALSGETPTAAANVRMLRLDDFLTEAGPTDFLQVDFVKIDCEGYELEVIRGGELTIRENRPCIIVEQKPGHAQTFGFGETEAVDLLRSWGAKLRRGIQGDFIMSWDA